MEKILQWYKYLVIIDNGTKLQMSDHFIEHPKIKQLPYKGETIHDYYEGETIHD